MVWGGKISMAEVRIQEGEPLDNALRRFKRKVLAEDIIKDVKRHSYYLKPGERRRVKQALARKRARKKSHRDRDDPQTALRLRIRETAEARSRMQVDGANRQKEQAQTDAAKAQSETAQAKSDMTASEAASATVLAAAQADTSQARSAAQLSEQKAQAADTEKSAMRARLETQLNMILQTHDSARGLIVNMSDVLFDAGKYTLMPGAREKLAKVAGILLAYPSLNIAVGGYTDNVGSSQLNQRLSEQRAAAVRDYLVKDGVAGASVTAMGYGDSKPVASNSSAAGRQANRRVELVVSGEPIGHQAAVTTGNLR
jgi:ribosomal protein S21